MTTPQIIKMLEKHIQKCQMAKNHLRAQSVWHYEKSQEIETCKMLLSKIQEESQSPETANEPLPIAFGRWLLKYATHDYKDSYLCWNYESKHYDTDELYSIFKNQNP